MPPAVDVVRKRTDADLAEPVEFAEVFDLDDGVAQNKFKLKFLSLSGERGAKASWEVGRFVNPCGMSGLRWPFICLPCVFLRGSDNGQRGGKDCCRMRQKCVCGLPGFFRLV